jgi:hypothetical protein
VAEISAQKLKGAGENKGWPEDFVAEFWQNFTKSGRKGADEYFLKMFLIKHSYRDKEKLNLT